jgi:hypothetical protein
MARAWWLVVVPPILSEMMAGRGPGDDEDWGWWSIKQMMFQALGAIPMARDLARPVWDGITGGKPFDYQLSPLQRTGQVGVEVAKDVGRMARGDETKHATKDALEATGYWTGSCRGSSRPPPSSSSMSARARARTRKPMPFSCAIGTRASRPARSAPSSQPRNPRGR